MRKRSFSLMLLLILLAGRLTAQPGNAVPISIQAGTTLRLDGNSTMHEYSATASVVTGSIMADSALLGWRPSGGARFFRQAELTIPVKEMHSGNAKLDDKMYDALGADDHPNILYRLTGDTIVAGSRADTLTLLTSGILSVGGKEKVIELPLVLTRDRDSTVHVRGRRDLLMTDFGIEPPSMMLGLLKTDDKVIISFDVRLRSH